METRRILCLGTVAAMSLLGCSEEKTSRAQRRLALVQGLSEDDRLEERAERGLAISPVPINTKGLSHGKRLQIGLGSYIANGTSDCNGCHGSPAGFLAGGNPFSLGDGEHFVWSRNLTPDPATGLPYTESQFLEVIRTGRDLHYPANKMLLVMPWVIFRWMSDDDLKAVYAYLRAVPPVNNVVPLDNKNDLPVGSSLPFAGRYDDGEVDRPLPKEDEGFTVRRGLAIAPRRNPRHLGGDRRETFGIGSYIANSMTHCNDCHTSPDRTPDFRKINFAAYLTGGTVFEVPPPFQMPLRQVRTMSANLTGATRGFFNEPNDSFQRFHDLIHTGSHVDEKPPRPLGFPMNLIAANLSKVLDEDLEAIYQYVKAVPSVAGPADKITQDYARWCASNPDCRTGESCFLGTHECVGRACGADLDCEVCQTCGGGACQAPAPSSPCVLTAH